MGAHDSHPHHHDDDGEPASTGFLPITLAVVLFVTGLFALGFVQCGALPPVGS